MNISEKSRYKLKFANPVFHKGLNTTIRCGKRLGNLPEVQGLFEIEGSQKRGRVVHKQVYFLEDLPLWVLEREHNPDCRSVDDLLDALGQPKMTDEVTVVGFYLE